MQQLNSVLIEGTLSEDPRYVEVEVGDTMTCRFTILNQRDDGSVGVEIRTQGMQARSCSYHLLKGRRVRVVGRLAEEVHNSHREVNVIAEHVEFCPEDKNERNSG